MQLKTIKKKKRTKKLKISNKFKNTETSITTQIFNQIKDLESLGHKIISFTAGDPCSDISNIMKKSIKKALEKETNHYTSTLGTINLRKIIATKISETDNSNISFKNIIITNGAKQGINSIINAIIDPNDEVIIFNPTWRAYSEITKLAGGVPVFINLKSENNYNIDFNELENNINEKTKIIIINNPNNPNGKIINKKYLQQLVEIAKKYNILLLADEVYREIVFNDNFVSLNSLINEENRDNIVVVNSLSKSNAMAGWRLGYINSPLYLIEPLTILQAYTTTNVNVLAQEIAEDAILHDDEFIKKQRLEFREKSRIICNYIENINGMEIDIYPESTFYIWVNINKINPDSIKFCKEILENIHVSLVPGIDFGIDGYIRISCSNSLENIHIGMKKLTNYLNNN